MFDHFVELALKGLRLIFGMKITLFTLYKCVKSHCHEIIVLVTSKGKTFFYISFLRSTIKAMAGQAFMMARKSQKGFNTFVLKILQSLAQNF